MILLLLILLLQSVSGKAEQLEDLLQDTVLLQKCPLVCRDLEGRDFTECMNTCVLGDKYLYGLENCGLGCLTACFSSPQTESYISRLDIQDCFVSWETTGDSDCILVGEDVQGTYNILYQGDIKNYLFQDNNEEKWRSIILFLVGKTGLEDKRTIQFKHPLNCNSEMNEQTSLLLTQEKQPIRSIRLQGILLTSVICIIIISMISIILVWIRASLIAQQQQVRNRQVPTQDLRAPTQSKIPPKLHPIPSLSDRVNCCQHLSILVDPVTILIPGPALGPAPVSAPGPAPEAVLRSAPGSGRPGSAPKTSLGSAPGSGPVSAPGSGPGSAQGSAPISISSQEKKKPSVSTVFTYIRIEDIKIYEDFSLTKYNNLCSQFDSVSE